MEKVNVFWFRRDLRLDDNTALYYALTEGLPVLPIFIFDKQILDKLSDKSDPRVTFIQSIIENLDKTLSKNGSGVLTFYSDPQSTFTKLQEQYQINAVYTNRDYEPYAKLRDEKIEALLSKNAISFYSFKDHVMYERGEILNGQNEPYKVFTPYSKQWLSKFQSSKVETFDSQNLFKNTLKQDFPKVKSLEEMNFTQTSIDLPDATLDKAVVENYEESRNFPAKKGTTRLGIHLRFGTISIRKAVQFASKHSDTWLNELIWREFYIMILAHFPHVVENAFKSKYDKINWVNNEAQFEKWCEGKTGYPIVDAGMRELNATGFMHNRVRMITASFLTKHLLIDWRWGEAYFASKLLDFELASNNGGWQWAAGTGTDAQPYFRVFNPYSQQAKFDPNYAYIKKWVSELDSPSYPKPIVDHKEARVRAINTYKEAVS